MLNEKSLLLFRAQFSLSRMLIVTTIFCVVLAIALKYPGATNSLTLNVLLFAPAMAVAGIACWLSGNWRHTLFVAVVGMIVGWLCAPCLFVNFGRSPTFWDKFMIDFHTIGISTAMGALFFAGLEWTVLVILRLPERPSSRQPNSRDAL